MSWLDELERLVIDPKITGWYENLASGGIARRVEVEIGKIGVREVAEWMHRMNSRPVGQFRARTFWIESFRYDVSESRYFAILLFSASGWESRMYQSIDFEDVPSPRPRPLL